MVDARKILKEVYEAAHELFGDKLRDVYLYGSYARGDFREDSDVDILVSVDLPPDELASFWRTFAHIGSEVSLENDVTVSIAWKSYDQFHRYSASLPYYRNVLREGIRYAT